MSQPLEADTRLELQKEKMGASENKLHTQAVFEMTKPDPYMKNQHSDKDSSKHLHEMFIDDKGNILKSGAKTGEECQKEVKQNRQPESKPHT